MHQAWSKDHWSQLGDSHWLKWVLDQALLERQEGLNGMELNMILVIAALCFPLQICHDALSAFNLDLIRMLLEVKQIPADHQGQEYTVLY